MIRDAKSGVVMPSVRIDDTFFDNPLKIDPKKQFLGLRTGDRIQFNLDFSVEIENLRKGVKFLHHENIFDFDNLMVRCQKGMTYLRHRLSFVPVLNEKEIQIFFDGIEKKLDCVLTRYISL